MLAFARKAWGMDGDSFHSVEGVELSTLGGTVAELSRSFLRYVILKRTVDLVRQLGEGHLSVRHSSGRACTVPVI